ncbi:hypothetical protein FDF59_07965, partial [Clostridium botulinum]|nr:hypothetical protein [Clostridium botulinum]
MNTEEIKGIIQSYIQQGLLKEAEEVILQYKNIIGYDDEIASMEAILKIYNSDYDKALMCIREGLKVNIFNGDLYFTMGNIYEIQGEYDRAYLCYEYAINYTYNEENKNTILSTMNNLKSKYDIR